MMSYTTCPSRIKTTTKAFHQLPKTNQICALLAIVLGLWTLIKTQSLTKEFFDPISEACSSTSSGVTRSSISQLHKFNLRQRNQYEEIDERQLHEEQDKQGEQSQEEVKLKEEIMDEKDSAVRGGGGYKLHPHEPWLGGSFVCLITQFLHELIQHSGGIFTFGIIASLSIITGLLMNVEADRSTYYHHNTQSIIRYPTMLGILSQVLGISVVFPLLWVPSYCLVHARTATTHTVGITGTAIDAENTGNVCKSRVYAALVTALLFPMLTLLVFNLDPDSYAWTFSAGLLGGPLVACSPMLLWFVMPSSRITQMKSKTAMTVDANNNNNMNVLTSNINKKTRNHNEQQHNKAEISHTLSVAYTIAGIVAFIGYIVNVSVLIKAHGLDLSSIWDELWNSADPTVAFMTIDVSVLFVGVLLYIQLQKNGSKGVVKALALLPFLGPGSACAYVLSIQEYQRAVSLEVDAEKDR